MYILYRLDKHDHYHFYSINRPGRLLNFHHFQQQYNKG